VSAWFIVWIVTTQVVNLVFYLGVTRVACGWRRTLGAYALVYILPLLVLCGVMPCTDVGRFLRWMPWEFLSFYAVWCVLTILMSRESRGRVLFAVLVCGVHQVGAFSFSLILMHRLHPAWLGALCGIVLMAGMGHILARSTLPRVRRMPIRSGWANLNATAAANFCLLFATGFWPTFAVTGGWNEIATFVVANAVAVVYFPVALSFAERQRSEYLVQRLSDSTRVLQADLAAVRASEEGARRVRHDMRHHVGTLRELLKDGQSAAALHYLDNTFSHELLLPPLNARWCENALVNAILTMGSGRAKAKGLEFVAEASVPAALVIREPDLVALLGNLLENAVNGAAGGQIDVSILETHGALRIGVSNRVSDDFVLIDGLPCARSGVGILSIQAVIEKYHGFFDYELSDGKLTARVMIGGVV